MKRTSPISRAAMLAALALTCLETPLLAAIGLYQAFPDYITLSAQSSSGYNETKLVVRNLQSYPVDVDFTTACFVQSNSSQRVGLAYEKSTGGYVLRLNANTSYTLYFQSRCLDKSRSTPSTGVSYTTIRDISSFTQIVNALRSNYTQASVWSITDGANSQAWKNADPRNASGGGGGSTVSQGSLDLTGSVGWSTRGRLINIRAGRVSNNSLTRTTGSLRLRVWATRSRYAGGSMRGYVLGTRRLQPLAPGYYYTGISGDVALARPPRGSYYTTMTLEEYTTSGWVIRRHRNFSGRSSF
jgi:hypothetical protein